MAVAELAPAPGLLLVAAMALGGLADGLLVRNPRRLEVDLGAEARLQAVHDHLDVNLREARHDLLGGLGVAVQIDRGVLLLEAAQGGEHLVLVTLALGLDRERHHRRRQFDAGHLDRLVAGRQPVSGSGLLQLGDRADVAWSELRGMGGVAALEGHELAEALLAVGAGVQDLRVMLEHSLVDAEHVDPPGERVGPGLEYVGEQLAVLDWLERHPADLQAPVLDG